MPDINSSLRVGERVVVTAKKHAGGLILPLIVLVASVIFYIAVKPTASGLQVVALLIAAIGAWMLFMAATHLIGTSLAITDQRIFGESGLFPRRIMTLALSDIDSADAKQDLIGRLLGYGTVVINAVVKGNLRIEYRAIAQPKDIAAQIRAQMALPTVKATANRAAS
jgi:uncharacterized membrane protein YdbT with pleckstrin-like domain